MARLLLFNKPWRVLSQFTDGGGRPTLADYIDVAGVYPAGRLDFDSEGLLLLTDDGLLQQRISDPAFKLWKTYLVQVEGAVTAAALEQLRTGVALRDGPTRPARARVVPPPETLWSRSQALPSYREARSSWLEMSINEGRNRQVRRMTAAVGLPTLRLVRTRIGNWALGDLPPGAWRSESVHLPGSVHGRGGQRPARRRPRRKN